jgi:hypothetical protein
MYYMGFSYVEAYNIPVWQRRWFIQRINKEFMRAAEANQPSQSKAAHTNTAETRALMGNQRQEVPARLRRFT